MKLTKKKLTHAESISFQLKHAREELSLSIPEVADKLKMNKEHIELIEAGQYDRLPFATIYQKKLLGNYAELLGISKQIIMKQFEIEKGSRPAGRSEGELTTVKIRRFHDWKFNLPFVFRVGGVSLTAVFLLGYLGFQVKQIVKPPQLQLFAPLDGMVTKDQAVEVKGKTDSEVKVMINGKEVKHSEQGVFNEPLTLTPGVNTIIISATTKHGKTSTLTRYVVAQKDTQFTLGQSNVTRN